MIPTQVEEHPPELESIRAQLGVWSRRIRRLGDQVRRGPATAGAPLEDQLELLSQRRRSLSGKLERVRRGEPLERSEFLEDYRSFCSLANRVEVAVTK